MKNMDVRDEQEQRSIIYRPASVHSKNLVLAKIIALVAHEPETSKVKNEASKTGKEIIEAESEEVNPKVDVSQYYTLE